jgi:hypothetical protein
MINKYIKRTLRGILHQRQDKLVELEKALKTLHQKLKTKKAKRLSTNINPLQRNAQAYR